MEYQWNLAEVYVKDVDGHTDVVVGVNGFVACKNDIGGTGVSSNVKLPVDYSDLTSFVDIESIDKATVEAWATASLTPEQVAQYQAEALADSHFYGSTVKYMPWGAKIK